MSDLNKILKEEYDKKKNTITTQSLIEMIEEMMNLQEAFGLVLEEPSSAAAQQVAQQGTPAKQSGKEMTLRWRPYVPVSEIAWGTASGDSNQDARDVDGDGNISDDEKNPARAQLKMYLKNITDGGADLKAKIDALNSFLKNINSGDKSALKDMGKSLSFMMFYRTLYDVITDFNASAAGFIFESFLSVLLDAEQGHQVPASGAETIADFIVYAGGRVPISLKVYAESGLKVGGSYKQIVSDLTGEFDMMQYVVVTKQQVGGKDGTPKTTEGLKFAAFNIKLDSLAQILEWTKHGKDQMALPLGVVAAWNSASGDESAKVAAVTTALGGEIAGKGFETATVTHSKFGPGSELDAAQQQRHTIALDIPAKAKLTRAPGVDALITALRGTPALYENDSSAASPAVYDQPQPMDRAPLDAGILGKLVHQLLPQGTSEQRKELANKISNKAIEWFGNNYEMADDPEDALVIGSTKGEHGDLMNSGGTLGLSAAQAASLWGELYGVLPEELKEKHASRYGVRKNNFLKAYIKQALDAASAAQKAYKAETKGAEGGDDPHTARVKAIYGERTPEQKAISIQILKALGKADNKEAAKKAWHLTAGYQGIGGDAQFELTGKGTFKKLYGGGLIELPYGGGAEDGTFATVSLKKDDVMKTVNTVLTAFNENMTNALNGMQDLIDDMNSYVLGGLRDAEKAEAAQKDAEVVEGAMTAQYEEHEDPYVDSEADYFGTDE